jgi:thiol-disulfide isomerase/thioredoxin
MIWEFARFLLAGLFGLAAITKLGDHEDVRRTVAEFGVPQRLAEPVGWLLMGCEAAVAVALVVRPSSRIGAGLAGLLLTLFGGVVAITVARGRRPECHCFGRLHATPVNWSTVSRNVALAIGAAFVAAGGHPWAVFAGLLGLAAGTWLVLQIHQPGALRRGSRAREFELGDAAGNRWTLGSLLALGKPLLLVFADPACGACEELMPQIARWQQSHDSRLTVAVLSGGSAAENAALGDRFALRFVLTDELRATTGDYRVTATPTAVLIDRHARIAADQARGAPEISDLVARTVAPEPEPVLGRRAALVRGAAGAGALTVVPLVSSAVAAGRALTRLARPKKLKIDGAWLCHQRYALCTFAACKPSPTNKKISICRCRVKTGYSVGFKNCDRRAPKGRQLHSNFSLQDVTKRTRVLKCSARGLWVQCLDVVCHLDPNNPKQALCQCVNERTKNFYTFGGNCDTKTCDTVIWSATTAPFPGGAQYEKGLKRLGISFPSPAPCPTKR